MMRLLKLGGVTVLILGLFVGSGFLYLFVTDPDRLRKLQCQLLSQICRGALKVLGVRVYFPAHPDRSLDRNYLILANHLSYLDVLILASQFDSVFVTSVEVRDSGFLGWICQAAGCLFVERRKKTQVQEGIGEISWQLSNGLNVVLFPEATSSNGESVLPFRKSLVMAAVQAGVEVLPVCLNYSAINSCPITAKEKDLLFYYGEMTFLPHLWKVLSLESIEVNLDRLAPLPVYSTSCRKELTSSAYQAIRSRYQRIG